MKNKMGMWFGLLLSLVGSLEAATFGQERQTEVFIVGHRVYPNEWFPEDDDNVDVALKQMKGCGAQRALLTGWNPTILDYCKEEPQSIFWDLQYA